MTTLSCGEQLHGSRRLKAIGFTVPQTSVHSETLHSLCMRVGQSCLQHHVIGYVSVDAVAFLDYKTKKQKVRTGERKRFMLPTLSMAWACNKELLSEICERDIFFRLDQGSI